MRAISAEKALALASRCDDFLREQVAGIGIVILRSRRRELDLRIHRPDELVGRDVRHRGARVRPFPCRSVVVRLESARHVEQPAKRELRVSRILRQVFADRRVDRDEPLRFQLQDGHGRKRLRVAADLIETFRRDLRRAVERGRPARDRDRRAALAVTHGEREGRQVFGLSAGLQVTR